MAVRLIGQKAMNRVVAHHKDSKAAVRREGRSVESKARSNLAKARSSTQWSKIFGASHLTFISSDETATDVLIHLNAPNAMAIEFGHSPSGVFGPDGSLGHIDTKAPEGLYILIRAAGLAGAT